MTLTGSRMNLTGKVKNMMLTDQQQFSEIIDIADVSVRAASQLRLLQQNRPLRDRVAIERADRFLAAAIDGGEFVSKGNVGGMLSTLRPLNWAADVQFRLLSPVPSATQELEAYDELVKFLGRIQSVLREALENRVGPDETSLKDAVSFFQQLGENLGTIVDQRSRQSEAAAGLPPMLAMA